MNSSPLVTIITVVYNGEMYLEQTINSVVNQTYKNIEYMIIDGGSTDATIDIIKRHENHLAFWISEPDRGIYDAMNKGIRMAKGNLIGMINSDDWYELDAVQLMVDAFLQNPHKSIFHADRFDILENGERKLRKFHPSNFKFKYYGMTYNHPSMFITKTEYKKHLYNTELIALSDYQFVLEAFLRNKETFFYLNKVIVNYRLDGTSAKIGLNKRIREALLARKALGMNYFEIFFAMALEIGVGLIGKFKPQPNKQFHKKD